MGVLIKPLLVVLDHVVIPLHNPPPTVLINFGVVLMDVGEHTPLGQFLSTCFAKDIGVVILNWGQQVELIFSHVCKSAAFGT